MIVVMQFLPYNRLVVAVAGVGGGFFRNRVQTLYIAGAVDFLKLDYCQHRRGTRGKTQQGCVYVQTLTIAVAVSSGPGMPLAAWRTPVRQCH